MEKDEEKKCVRKLKLLQHLCLNSSIPVNLQNQSTRTYTYIGHYVALTNTQPPKQLYPFITSFRIQKSNITTVPWKVNKRMNLHQAHPSAARTTSHLSMQEALTHLGTASHKHLGPH